MSSDSISPSERDFEVTPLAVKKALELMDDLGHPAYGLRVGVAAAGCNGFTYRLEWTNDVDTDDDRLFYFGRFKVVIDARSFPFLVGTVMDWETNLIGFGFKFENPIAKSMCGCGTSFDV
jgi:iron-sulfur cluster assembly accessory protein